MPPEMLPRRCDGFGARSLDIRSRAVAGMVVGYWGCASTILLCGVVCVSVVKGGGGVRGKKEI